MQFKFLGENGLARFLVKLRETFSEVGHTHYKSEIKDFPTIPTKTSELTNDSGFKTTDNNTTYTLTKSGSVITLTGADGSTTSVEDSDTKTTVDSVLSSSSTNPVQNKTVTNALSSKLSSYGDVLSSTFVLSARNESDGGRSIVKLGERDVGEFAYIGDAGENYVRVTSSGVYINNLMEPIDDTHPATKNYVDAQFDAAQKQISQLSSEKVNESRVNALIDAKLGVIENGSY